MSRWCEFSAQFDQADELAVGDQLLVARYRLVARCRGVSYATLCGEGNIVCSFSESEVSACFESRELRAMRSCVSVGMYACQQQPDTIAMSDCRLYVAQ
jgi:hypothetical protein